MKILALLGLGIGYRDVNFRKNLKFHNVEFFFKFCSPLLYFRTCFFRYYGTKDVQKEEKTIKVKVRIP